ncbi:MAG: DUF3830 family protein [Chloroflexota bacterium]|nr:DUF3830 family protein [Chloroflexota bacterium]
MRYIEIDLDGTAVRAVVNEDVPTTANAIWDALPFEGRAVHAQIAGEMFRMLDATPIGEVPLEQGQSYQAPGELIYYPPIKELAISLGEARFRGHAGVVPCTPLAQIEGDFSAFAAIAHKLDETGAKPIRFRKAADQTSPFRYATLEGPKLEVEIDGVTATATLLESLAPRTAAEFSKLLPLDGRAWNDSLSGEVTRFEHELALNISEPENGKFMLWPGYFYYYPAGRGLRFCWGQGSVHNLSLVEKLTPIAALNGDWSEIKKRAQSQLTDGAKRLVIRKRN